MTPQEPTDLDTLTAYAEGYAEFSMKNIGRVAPTMLAVSPDGLLHFIPESLTRISHTPERLSGCRGTVVFGYQDNDRAHAPDSSDHSV